MAEKKKTTKSRKKKLDTALEQMQEQAVADSIAAEEAFELDNIKTVPADEIVIDMSDRSNDDRVKCVICGHETPKAYSFRVGDDYVCSHRCLAKYARTHS